VAMNSIDDQLIKRPHKLFRRTTIQFEVWYHLLGALRSLQRCDGCLWGRYTFVKSLCPTIGKLTLGRRSGRRVCASWPVQVSRFENFGCNRFERTRKARTSTQKTDDGRISVMQLRHCVEQMCDEPCATIDSLCSNGRCRHTGTS